MDGKKRSIMRGTLAVLGTTAAVVLALFGVNASAAAADGTSAMGYEATTESGVKVFVDAPEGALPEGAELHAELVETEKDNQAVADELEKAEVSYDGFLALDVFFTDADGNEVEPAEPVDVRFELPEGTLPEGAEDLAVHHLAEAEDGTVAEIEAVADDADATEGTVAVQDDASVDAEFTVDSFSSFVISWNSHLQITVHYVDENGNDIRGTQTSQVSLINGSSKQFNDYAGKISGYTYVGAYLNAYNGDPVASVTARRERYLGTYVYYYTIYNSEGKQVEQLSSWGIDAADVYLVYKTEESEPELPESNATVTTGKSAVKLEDGSGNYELNLSVSGDRGSREQKQKVDVLFILDESNSMAKSWGLQTRIDAAKSAISQIVGYGNNQGLSDNEALDVRFAAVGFYGGANDEGGSDTYNDASELRDWTSSANELYSAIPGSLNSQRQNGGTNYEAGLLTGKEVLEGARKDALVVTIFITDGNPGFYYNTSGETAGSSNPTSYDRTALQHAVDECETLNTDYFYMVGVTNSVDTTVFNDMLDAVNVLGSNKGKYVASDADQLLQAFADIQKQITFFDTQGVKMTDPLSENADLVANDDGSYSFTLELEKRDNAQSPYETVDTEEITVSPNAQQGTNVTIGDGSQTVEMTVFVDVDASGKETIRVEFADDYRLAQNYRYTVSSTIAPSESAISAFEASDANAYNDTGDAYTGTHTNQQGFWSNDNANAKVDFTPIAVEGDNVTELEPDEAPFPKPVIQVDKSLVTPPEPVKPDLHKYVKDNDDGTYDLNLDVHGKVRQDQSDPTKVDIVYVLDLSYSMMWEMNGDFPDDGYNPSGDEPGYSYSYARYIAALDSIKALNSSLDQEGIDARAALVAFANDADPNVAASTHGFQSVSEFTIPDADYGLFESGTNWDAGLVKAKGFFSQFRSGARTVVVFISDGQPTYSMNDDGTINKNVGAEAACSAAEDVAKGMQVDDFYVVGVGQESFEQYLERLAISAESAERFDSFKGTSSDELVAKFEGIAAEITSVDCKNVVITDTLSDYAELADDAAFSVAIRNGAGEVVEVSGGPYSAETATAGVKFTFTDGSDNAQTLTLTYDAQAKSFTLAFPEDYALEAGWTYTVTTQIQPTEKAFTEFAKSGYGEIVGDANTDDPDGYYGTPEDEWTSSEKPGFYANSEATLTYVSADQPQEDVYPKPVIQVNATEVSGVLQVLKNLEGEDLQKAQFEFQVSAVDPNSDDTSTVSSKFAGWDNTTVRTFHNGEEAEDNIPLVHTGSDLTFDAGDINQKYAYIYEEVQDDNIDYAYDKTAWKVVVFVERSEDGDLVPYAQVYKDADGKNDQGNYEWIPCDADLSETSGEAAKIKLEEKSDGTPAITIQFNNKVSKADLSITKTVNGAAEGVSVPSGVEFSIQVELKDEQDAPIDGTFEAAIGDQNQDVVFDENGRATVKLKAEQTIIIKDVPVGATCKVTEPEDMIPGGFRLQWIGKADYSEEQLSTREAIKKEYEEEIQTYGNDVVVCNAFIGYGLSIFKGELAYDENGDIATGDDGLPCADPNHPLSGAVFEISALNENDEKQPFGRLETDDDGKAVFMSLSGNDGTTYQTFLMPGTYYINEVKVPSGYQLLGYEITLTIDGDGKATIFIPQGEGEDPLSKELGYDNDGNLLIEVANKPNPGLPSSGSNGTLLMMSTGFAAIVLAGTYLSKRFGHLWN